MGANIEGKGRIFAKDMGGWTSYSLGVSNKDQNGNYINAYQPVRFKKGINVPNGTDIDFRGFATVAKGKNNFVLWQITEFRIAGDDMPADNFTALTDEDIPY